MAIGQGGYTGKLEEIMDALEPQSDQGQFFKDYLDYKQADNPSYVSGSTDGNSRRVFDLPDAMALGLWGGISTDYREARGFDSAYDVWNQYYEQGGLGAKPIVEAGANVWSQTPEFLSDMGKFWGEAWEGKSPLDAPVVSAVTGPVDTALALGSGALTGAVSGLEGIARGFSLDESGWPVWSVDEADEAIAHRTANFPAYHAQTTMGKDVSNLVGGAIEGWGEHVGQPAGRFVQSAIEWVGGDKETAINVGGIAAGAVSAGPLALPFLKKSRETATKPMYEGGFSVKEMRLALEDQVGIANNFKAISNAWREINPEAWRAALEKDQLLKDGSFGREVQRIQDVVTQDLRETGVFIFDEMTGTGIPKNWVEYGIPVDGFGRTIFGKNVNLSKVPRWLRDRNWYGRKKGDVMGYGHDASLLGLRKPEVLPAQGYMSHSDVHFPTFTRDAKGNMLPNWGRGRPEDSLVRQRNVVVGKQRYFDKKGKYGERGRGTSKHEWTHVLDDILYFRLAPEARAMHRVEHGMPLDYKGNPRFIRDVRRLDTPWTSMASDLSPVLKRMSEKIIEAEFRARRDSIKQRAEDAYKSAYEDWRSGFEGGQKPYSHRRAKIKAQEAKDYFF